MTPAAIRTAQAADREAMVDTLRLSFSADPCVRYIFPRSSDFMAGWPTFVMAMGGRGLDHGTAFVTEDTAAVSLWLPPGVESDLETMLGVLMSVPPEKGAAYPVFVPKTDADGRDLAGIRLPTLEAPVATHTGWNLRKTGFGYGELCDNNGSMIPFAATREERLNTGDPRLSLAERYPHEGDRAAAIAKAAQQLVQHRLLLEDDAKLFAPTVN